MSLPETDSYVELRLLNGGSMLANARSLHHDIEDDRLFRLYDWCFYIHQPEQRRNVLWDVGMSVVRMIVRPRKSRWFSN